MTRSYQKRSLRTLSLFALVCASMAGCSDCGEEVVSDEDASADVRTDDVEVDTLADVPPVADDVADVADVGGSAEHSRTPLQDGVTPDGHGNLLEALGDDEVRVGRIMGEQTFFTGVDSHCRRGDFLIYNSVVSVCIQSETTNRLESFTGGMIVDARRVGDEGEDVLDFVLPLMELRTQTAKEVRVIRDGSDGLAVLRVVGEDIEIAFLAGALGARLGNSLRLEVTTEYRLRPGEDAVEMVSWYTRPDGGTVAFKAGDIFVWGDRARPWSDGLGFEVGRTPRAWMAGIGQGKSFAMVYEDMVTPLGIVAARGLPWGELRAERVRLSEGNEESLRRWFVIGDGSLDSIRHSAARLRGETLETSPHGIEVLDGAGAPVAGVGVLITDEEGNGYTFGETGADGRVFLDLEAGQVYGAVLEGLAGDRTLKVAGLDFGSEALARVEVPQAGRLSLSVHEVGTDAALTARVELRGESVLHFFSLHGELEVDLPVGAYRLIVMRGPEYDHEAMDIEIVAGETLERRVELLKALDTRGWRSGDFHQHMEPSPDSTLELRLRVLDNAAAGVEIMVPTDHDVVTDLGPIIAELGLEDVLSTFPGVEISPAYTHMNIYPVPYQPDLRGRGTIELVRMVEDEVVFRRVPEIIAMARTMEENPIVQLNHARNNSGFFAHTDYDPELGYEAVEHPDFSIDFDAMEIVNRVRDTCTLMKDWSGLLNAGKIISGMGNSDTHRLDLQVGVPRSYLLIDAEPGAITSTQVRDAIMSQRVTVGAHAFLDFGDDMLPGDMIAASANEAVTFRPRVQTPGWAEATKLFVIVNGRIVQTLERSAAAGARFDFDETIALSFDKDSWVIFFAYGPQPSGDVRIPVPLIAFSNPIFIDVGGDANGDRAQWQAPGIGALDLDGLNQGFCD